LEKQLDILKSDNLREYSKFKVRLEKQLEISFSQFKNEYFLSLLSLVFFEYPINDITITNKQTEKLLIHQNQLTNFDFNFNCLICKNSSSELRVSLDGYFCCENCSEINTGKYITKKDKVETCQVTGNIVIPNENNCCNFCKNYAEDEFMYKTYDDINICEFCSKFCEVSNKRCDENSLIKTIGGNLVLPEFTQTCDYSNKVYLKSNIVKTTGDNLYIFKDFVETCQITGKTYQIGKLINLDNGLKVEPCLVKKYLGDKKYYLIEDFEETTGDLEKVPKNLIKICKKTKLTFSLLNLTSEGYWILFDNLKKMKTSELPVDILRTLVKSGNCEFAENNFFILITYSRFLKTHILIYNKQTNSINNI
jgi:hypothetical protein